MAKDYTGQASADMVSSAGDALLSVADPSPIATRHLVYGALSLSAPLQGFLRVSDGT